MPPVVYGEHSIAFRDTIFSKITITPGMFGITVYQQDYSFRGIIGEPLLHMQFCAGCLRRRRKRQAPLLMYQAIFLVMAIS